MNIVTADEIEKRFSAPDTAVRFANFCNALLVAQAPKLPTLPRLNEKPGSDGGIDGEWTIDSTVQFAPSALVRPGWNVYQFKTNALEGGGRDAAFDSLKSKVRKAVRVLVDRLLQPRTLSQYVLFTNLQLGVETRTKTASDAVLSKKPVELMEAIKEDAPEGTRIEIVDAAQLAALVNNYPAVKLAYFSTGAFLSWEEKWEGEQRMRDYKVRAPFMGRNDELKQIGSWLALETARVICINGPSGMGKTRLSLEATRTIAPRVVFVEQPNELTTYPSAALAASQNEWVFIVEDPEMQSLEKLAKWALTSPNIKLLLTVPSATDTPRPALRVNDGIEQLSLYPLRGEAPRKLLDATGTSLDSRARDWVLLQAGGVPEILLAAAEAGAEIREHAGKLRTQLSSRLRKKVQSRLGDEALAVLRLLSLLQAVNTADDAKEIDILCELSAPRLDTSIVRDHLPALEQLGYVRRRGKSVSVVPPMFAADLLHEALAMEPSLATALFDRLQDTARKRFLERLVTAEPDDVLLWEYIFGKDGPFGDTLRAIGNLSLLNFLARAVPRRTMGFLQRNFADISRELQERADYGSKSELLEVLYELIEEPDTANGAIVLLEQLAVYGLRNGAWNDATGHYCETYVHWYPFPLSLQNRMASSPLKNSLISRVA